MQRFKWVILLFASILCIAVLGWFLIDRGPQQQGQVVHRVGEQLDALAAQVPVEEFEKQSISWSGDLTGWLVSHLELSKEEEAKLALDVHQKLLKKNKVEQTPDDVQPVIDQLVKHIPKKLRPLSGTFLVSVFDSPQAEAFTSGAGYLYVTNSWLAQLGKPDDRAASLAFLIAHEMGHVCRHHARQGYEMLLLSESRDFGMLGKLGGQRFQSAYEKMVRKVGEIVHFAYDDRQDTQADLFAIHLCRNAGWDLEKCLDGLRIQVLESQPEWKKDARDGELSFSKLPDSLPPETISHLRRLAALRVELDGTFPGDAFGLYRYNKELAELKQTNGEELTDAQEIIVVVHGMESGLSGFLPLMKELATEDTQTVFLGYQYPNDASLARSAIRLHHEIERVCPKTANLKFICHSAGGLVTRYYSEIMGGRAEKVVFLGTPHSGSDLVNLRAILELKQVLSGLSLDVPKTLEDAIVDGDGQISFDLEPDSLFLRYLNQQQAPGDRYAIFRGRAISESKAAPLQMGFNTALKIGKLGLLPLKFSATGKRALARLEKVQIPNEITAGDLAVTLESANLPGAAKITTINCDHSALVSNSEVIQQTQDYLSERNR